MSELPFFRKRVRHLQHLDVVERFFEDEHLIGVADSLGDLIPGIIGIGRANDDLQIGKFFPDPRDRFDSIPTRRHAHIDERNRVRISFRNRRAHFFQAFFALKGGIDLKTPGTRSVGLIAEKRGFVGIEFLGEFDIGWAEDLAEILMNRRIVIDDENAVILQFRGEWRCSCVWSRWMRLGIRG